MTLTTTAYVVHDQDTKDYWMVGGFARIIAESAHTGNRFCFGDMTHNVGDATPLHVHKDADEAFYVLEGEIRGVCGDDEWHGAKGSFIWLPRGVPHAYQAAGAGPLKVLVMFLPGGFDAFVAEAGAPAGSSAGAPVQDPVALVDIAARHGMDILGPPVNFLG